MYQAHYSCSALSTKHTSIAQHYYYFAQHSTQRTLRMLSIEHSMPLQRCLLSFAQASYTQVCSIKELGSVHSKSMFCRHTVLQPGPIACHIGNILKVHIIMYTLQCTVYILRAHQHLVPWPALLLLKELPPANILQSNPFLCTKCSVMKNSASISVFFVI